MITAMDVKKIYQMFILGTGNLDEPVKNGLGGVIYFTRDISSAEQFTSLIDNLNKKSSIPMFMSIDQEGGRVERTENIHRRFLSAKYAFQNGLEFLAQQTENIASELSSYGINMNFAPCLDVNTNPDNPIIGERAFSDNPDEVCLACSIVSDIYRLNGIIPVIKHFPGHGDASKDSHKELPLIDLSMEEMERVHIKPFKYAIEHGAEAVMAAHLHCSCFDKEEVPASLSKNCLNYLRNQLKFNGVIISDDMFMQGVKKYGMAEACILGIKSGLNMFIYRDSDDDTLNTIENVITSAQKDSELREKIDFSYNKIIELKRRYNLIKQ